LHDLAGAADPVPGLDARRTIEQHAADDVAVERDCKAEFAVLEAQKFV
jgi:hypothetical protein